MIKGKPSTWKHRYFINRHTGKCVLVVSISFCWVYFRYIETSEHYPTDCCHYEKFKKHFDPHPDKQAIKNPDCH